MEIKQTIHVSRPPDVVWAVLGDVPTIVTCIPGATLGEALGDDRYKGTFNLKVGPLSAKVEGEGKIERNESNRTGRLVGRGIDKRGGSRVGVNVSYAVVPDGTGSAIDVTAETDLSGPLAQIGRTGIIEDVARRLTAEFAAALEAKLGSSDTGRPPTAGTPDATGDTPKSARQFNAGKALRSSLWSRLVALLKRLFGR